MENKELYLIEGEFLESLLKYFAAKGHQACCLHIKDILNSPDFSVVDQEAKMFRFIEEQAVWQKDEEERQEWWEVYFPSVFSVDERLLDFREYLEFIMECQDETEQSH